MRLRAWCKAAGRGEPARLAREVGRSYQTICNLRDDKNPASDETAELISAATGGVVTVDELTWRAPGSPRRRRDKGHAALLRRIAARLAQPTTAA